VRNSFFSTLPQNKFDSQFVQSKLDKVSALQAQKIFVETRKIFHQLDTYLTEYDFDKYLTPEQKKKLAKLYYQIGDHNFMRGRTSDDQEDPEAKQAFLYLQKAITLDPTNQQIKENMLSMWAETQPVPYEDIESGKWPSPVLHKAKLSS